MQFSDIYDEDQYSETDWERYKAIAQESDGSVSTAEIYRRARLALPERESQ